VYQLVELLRTEVERTVSLPTHRLVAICAALVSIRSVDNDGDIREVSQPQQAHYQNFITARE
jgi:hypothetical protein